jgi:hypothetical protein
MGIMTQYAARPRVAGEAIAKRGLVVRDSSDQWVICDDAGQATVAALKCAGINVTTATDSDKPVTVVTFGECSAAAGATIVNGDRLVAEAGTGRVIPFDPTDYSDGDVVHTIGTALEDAVIGQFVRINVAPSVLLDTTT